MNETSEQIEQQVQRSLVALKAIFTAMALCVSDITPGDYDYLIARLQEMRSDAEKREAQAAGEGQ